MLTITNRFAVNTEALVVMISSCNIFKLCKFGWYCILAVLALAIFCIYSAVKLIHEGS